MLPELSKQILGDWDNLFPETLRPDRIRYLGIPGSVEGGTTSFLGFSKESSKPLFAVKIHRQKYSEKRAINEKKILLYLEQFGGKIDDLVPRLILCKNLGGTWVLVQSVLDGRPMVGTMTPNGIPNIQETKTNIRLAVDWLLELHWLTRDRSEQSTNLLKQGWENIICEFSNTFKFSSNEQNYLCSIREEISCFESVVQHGDFCRHNILVDEKMGSRTIRVIDWTDSKQPGSPLHDLFFFLTTYYLQVRKNSGLNEFVRTFEHIFFGQTRQSSIVKEYVSEFCKRINLELTMARNLFALFLIERAVFEYRQVNHCAKYGGLPRFTLFLAGIENLSYSEAIKAQYWIHFFKLYIKNWRNFII